MEYDKFLEMNFYSNAQIEPILLPRHLRLEGSVVTKTYEPTNQMTNLGPLTNAMEVEGGNQGIDGGSTFGSINEGPCKITGKKN